MDEEVRIGCFVKRLLKHYSLCLLILLVIEKPDPVKYIGFDGKLQNFESWGELRPVECHPFQLESNERKSMNTHFPFKNYFS